MTTHVDKATAELVKEGGALDLGPETTRLVNRTFQLLAEGGPVRRTRVRDEIAALGIDEDAAEAVIDAWTERDDADNVVGLGITYNPTGHRMRIGGAEMWAWCAIDTLLFAILLDSRIAIESTAPGGGVTRLEASPEGVVRADPAGAVITWPVRAREEVDLGSTSAIWGTFCHHSVLFPSREQAQEWAGGRADVQILSLDEGFAIAQALAGAWQRYR